MKSTINRKESKVKLENAINRVSPRSAEDLAAYEFMDEITSVLETLYFNKPDKTIMDAADEVGLDYLIVFHDSALKAKIAEIKDLNDAKVIEFIQDTAENTDHTIIAALLYEVDRLKKQLTMSNQD